MVGAGIGAGGRAGESAIGGHIQPRRATHFGKSERVAGVRVDGVGGDGAGIGLVQVGPWFGEGIAGEGRRQVGPHGNFHGGGRRKSVGVAKVHDEEVGADVSIGGSA